MGELTQIAAEIQSGFDSMEREKSVARRRVMARETGLRIGKMIDLIDAANDAVSADTFERQASGRIVGDAVGHLLELCQWELKA